MLDRSEAEHFLRQNQRRVVLQGREWFDVEVATWLRSELLPGVRTAVGDQWRQVFEAAVDYPFPHADWERWYAVAVGDKRRYLHWGLYIPPGEFAAGTARFRFYGAVDLHGTEITRLEHRVREAFSHANREYQTYPREDGVRTYWTDFGELDFARVTDAELASRIAQVLHQLIDALAG